MQPIKSGQIIGTLNKRMCDRDQALYSKFMEKNATEFDEILIIADRETERQAALDLPTMSLYYKGFEACRYTAKHSVGVLLNQMQTHDPHLYGLFTAKNKEVFAELVEFCQVGDHLKEFKLPEPKTVYVTPAPVPIEDQRAELLTITELKAILRDKEKKAVIKIKEYSLQKWYWQETGEEYDFTNAGNNEMIFGVTGDFKAVVRKLNLPNYSKYIDKILYAFEGLHRELIQKDSE